MAKTTKVTKRVVRKRKERKNVERGAAHIASSFNNTIVTITDTAGSLTPTFVTAPPVGVAVRLVYAFTLNARFPSVLNEPLSASVTLLEATAPVKLPV